MKVHSQWLAAIHEANSLRQVHNIRSSERLFQHCDAHPNHFVCTSGHNTTQAKVFHSLEHNYIVNPS